MLPSSQSSGDLVADRRAAYARALAERGDFAAAVDLIEQALELAPDWAPGWSLCGDFRLASEDRAGAVSAWMKLAELDPTGIFGAPLKLAAHGAMRPIVETSQGYVAALFDEYAARFETDLHVALHYTVPERLAGLITAEMARRGSSRLGLALDLGCGTGLMGERLRRHVSYLAGTDLSAGMVAEADRKRIYDRLATDELRSFLGEQGAPAADLIAAADVFCYCGALAPIFASVAARLAPDGLFAFSLERHAGPEPHVVRPSLRIAHSAEATRAALAEAGLEVVTWQDAPLRLDRGEPVDGLLVLVVRPAAAQSVVDAAAPVVAQDAAPDPEPAPSIH